MSKSTKSNIYNDERDYLFKYDQNTLFLTEKEKYSLKREKIRFLLYNDITFFFNSNLEEIKYIKICHVIIGRAVFVHELINIKKFETLEILLNKALPDESQELYLIYYDNDKKRYFKNLSAGYNNLLKIRKDDIAHFHFENGNIRLIVPYFMKKDKIRERNICFLIFILFLISFLIIVLIDCFVNYGY